MTQVSPPPTAPPVVFCPCLWALSLVCLPLISCRSSQNLSISSSSLRAAQGRRVAVVKGKVQQCEADFSLYDLKLWGVMCGRAEGTDSEPNVYFSGPFVKYWWLFCCVIRWRALHARKKQETYTFMQGNLSFVSLTALKSFFLFSYWE